VIPAGAGSTAEPRDVAPCSARVQRTLAGPATVEVRTGNDPEPTAIIDRLFIPGSQSMDDRFPHFMALPNPTPFIRLAHDVTGFGSEVLAASDDEHGLLFVPFDFTDLLPPDLQIPLTRFLRLLLVDTA